MFLLGTRLIFGLGAAAALSLLDILSQPVAFAQTPMMLPTDPAPLVAETDAGRREFSVEIADDPRERSAGLMFRQSMADDHGMLFVMDGTGPVGFWMQNTPMPLDLLFIAEDGKVVGVLPGRPFSEDVISPGQPARFVLELKQGTAQRLGIDEGDRISHPAIGNAAPDVNE